MDPNWKHEPLAPLTIIADASGEQKYAGTYYKTIGDSGWIEAWAYYGDADELRRRFLHPDAICTDGQLETLTTADLVDNYRTAPELWRQYAGAQYRYSADVRTCYEVSGGWLLVDDIKICPVQTVVDSIDPDTVLAMYQNGEWDGMEALFSADYGTYVSVNWENNTLFYHYEAEYYSPEYDFNGLAYRNYAQPPAFFTMDAYKGFEVYGDAPEKVEKDYDEGGSFVMGRAEVQAYIDLPNGNTDCLKDALNWCTVGRGKGVYAFFPDRIERYLQGRLVDTWQCNVNSAYPFAERTYSEGVYAGEIHAHISDEEIVRLLPNGEVETVIDGIVDYYGISEYFLLELSLKDGKLVGYSESYGLVEIAENVASVDFAWNICIFTDKDGVRWAFDQMDYVAMEKDAHIYTEGQPAEIKSPSKPMTVHVLGVEPWENYVEMYYEGALDLEDLPGTV